MTTTGSSPVAAMRASTDDGSVITSTAGMKPALDCQTCGACCRAAYHSVEVARRDPAVKAQPDYIVDRGTYLKIRRNGDRCAALHGGEVHGEKRRASTA